MKHYEIHVPLDRFEGAKTGQLYSCTRGAVIAAPEGEFKELPQGAYSIYGGASESSAPSAASSDTSDDSPEPESED